MERLVDLGLVKSIGLSNFNSVQVDRVLTNSRIKPVVNQVNSNFSEIPLHFPPENGGNAGNVCLLPNLSLRGQIGLSLGIFSTLPLEAP